MNFSINYKENKEVQKRRSSQRFSNKQHDDTRRKVKQLRNKLSRVSKTKKKKRNLLVLQ